MRESLETDSPHARQPVLFGGEPIDSADAAVVLVHGRGATAQSILTLKDALDVPGIAYAAPQAANYTWYPNSFLAPLSHNEPHLSSALNKLAATVSDLEANFPSTQIVLMGFSQGACLALEFAARNPRSWGGVVAFSGGLIGLADNDGQPPEDKSFGYTGEMSDVPVFIGCSDRDPHVPMRRIEQSVEAFESLGATVTARIYKNMGHTINDDEIAFARQLLSNRRNRHSQHS